MRPWAATNMCRHYLPPYSPDLNPIELVFTKFKWLTRSMRPSEPSKDSGHCLADYSTTSHPRAGTSKSCRVDHFEEVGRIKGAA